MFRLANFVVQQTAVHRVLDYSLDYSLDYFLTLARRQFAKQFGKCPGGERYSNVNPDESTNQEECVNQEACIIGC